MYDQAPAKAFTDYGSARNWPPYNEPPSLSLGFTLGHGSWPIYKASEANTTRRLWRSPQATEYGSTLWDEPARFGSIDIWKTKPVQGWFLFDWLRQLAQWNADLGVQRRTLPLPWNKNWVTPGGTVQTSADNGVIIELSNGEYYEIQGMREINLSDIALINLRTASDSARFGDWVCDGILHYKKGTVVRGSQGPKAKHDGLLTPDFLSGFVPNIEVRLVGFNVEFGPEARAVKPGWVERPFKGYNGNPFGGEVKMPEGPDPERMIPNFLGMMLFITDEQIEEWLDWLDSIGKGGSQEMRLSRTWFARNLRGWPSDTVAPDKCRTRIRVSETGGFEPVIESVGGHNPKAAERFRLRGIQTDSDAWEIGHGILKFGALIVTDGIS